MTDRQVRFVLLTHHYCGADQLLDALAGIEGIRAYGELLNSSEHMRRMSAEPHLAHYRIGEDGADYLDKQVFVSARDSDVKAVGYAMTYEDARVDRFMISAWTYLIQSIDIRVIHLTRANPLERLVEQSAAERTPGWLDPSDGVAGYDVEPFTLSSFNCQEEFDRHLGRQLWAQQAFASHPVLEFDFDKDIKGDFQGALQRACEFLDVSAAPAAAKFQTPIQVDPHRIVVNFEELREHFRHTLYQDLFQADRAGLER